VGARHSQFQPHTVAYGGEGDTVFQAGDIIRNDYVSYYHGYPGHQSRTAMRATPRRPQRTYRIMRDIYRGTIDQCRVGVQASAIHTFAVEQFRAHGYHDRVSPSATGLAPGGTSRNPISSVPATRCEEGMVLALEPHVGYRHLQDTSGDAGGPQLLSDWLSTDDIRHRLR
jgi:Xaa-Pro aminopeptidase